MYMYGIFTIYILLHWVDFFLGKMLVNIRNSPMDPMGFPPVASLRGEEPFG